MKIKIIAVIVICGAVIISGAFFAGIKYQEKNTLSRLSNFSNIEQGGQGRIGQNSGIGTRGGGMIIGEIISKDNISITIKLSNGGSKIVFFTDSVSITKNINGLISDIIVGENIVVNGTANSDGSVNAKTIQLGPVVQGFR